MQDQSSLFFRTGEKHLYAMSRLCCDVVNTPSDMRIGEKKQRNTLKSLESEKLHSLMTKMYVRGFLAVFIPQTWYHR
jgi:hypothetical protein